MSLRTMIRRWFDRPPLTPEQAEERYCTCDTLGLGGPCAYHVDLWLDADHG